MEWNASECRHFEVLERWECEVQIFYCVGAEFGGEWGLIDRTFPGLVLHLFLGAWKVRALALWFIWETSLGIPHSSSVIVPHGVCEAFNSPWPTWITHGTTWSCRWSLEAVFSKSSGTKDLAFLTVTWIWGPGHWFQPPKLHVSYISFQVLFYCKWINITTIQKSKWLLFCGLQDGIRMGFLVARIVWNVKFHVVRGLSWAIHGDLPFSWRLADHFWKKCCMYICRKVVPESRS